MEILSSVDIFAESAQALYGPGEKCKRGETEIQIRQNIGVCLSFACIEYEHNDAKDNKAEAGKIGNMSVERLQGENLIPLEDGEQDNERTDEKKRMALRATPAHQHNKIAERHKRE